MLFMASPISERGDSAPGAKVVLPVHQLYIAPRLQVRRYIYAQCLCLLPQQYL